MPSAAEPAARSFSIVSPKSYDKLAAAGAVFDFPPLPEPSDRFLTDGGHHLLLAMDADGAALGFVSGVEMTHPDKGTEMFLYELGVLEAARGRGVATSLVGALRELATARGCYGMWVLTEPDNAAANATYRRAGAAAGQTEAMYSWDLTDGPAADEEGRR